MEAIFDRLNYKKLLKVLTRVWQFPIQLFPEDSVTRRAARGIILNLILIVSRFKRLDCAGATKTVKFLDGNFLYFSMLHAARDF